MTPETNVLETVSLTLFMKILEDFNKIVHQIIAKQQHLWDGEGR